MEENIVEPVETAGGEPTDRSALDRLLGRNEPEATAVESAPEVEPGTCPNPSCGKPLPEDQNECKNCGYKRNL